MSMKEGTAYPWGDSYDVGVRAGLITASRLHVSISRQCRLSLQTVRLHLKELHYYTFFPIVLLPRTLSTSLYRKIIS